MTSTRARLAVSVAFFVCGAVMAIWVARIPSIQMALGLSPGSLGIALLGVGAGALVGMPTAGALMTRFGSGRVTAGAGLAFCAALPLAALASSILLLLLALIVLGWGLGVLDVSMNAHGVAVEQRRGRALMSSFHALYSIGALAGAGVGAAIAGLGVSPLPHFIGATLLLGAVMAAVATWMLPTPPSTGPRPPAFARPTRDLAALGTIAFCSMLGEGAIADWSGVYMAGTLGAGPGLAAAAFAAFSLTITLARLVGDRLTDAVGAVRHVRWGAAVAGAGLALALAVPETPVALTGFALAGLGYASLVPIVFSAAGRVPTATAGAAIAAVATVGYTGHLAGPPVIGLLAEVITLRGALAIVVALSLAIVLLARWIESR